MISNFICLSVKNTEYSSNWNIVLLRVPPSGGDPKPAASCSKKNRMIKQNLKITLAKWRSPYWSKKGLSYQRVMWCEAIAPLRLETLYKSDLEWLDRFVTVRMRVRQRKPAENMLKISGSELLFWAEPQRFLCYNDTNSDLLPPRLRNSKFFPELG
jgi:hypothetical protein